MNTSTETRAERIILKHLTGSKAGQTEKLELGEQTEITFGRNPESQVAYDPDKDDLVSGQHARIVWDAREPHAFTLSDLGSRNHSFVNNQRVTSPVRLRPGDVIQLGVNGPKFEFDCEPRPEGLIKATRIGTNGSSSLSAAQPISTTRAHDSGDSMPGFSSGSLPLPGAEPEAPDNQSNSTPPAVNNTPAPGRTTVWNMITNAQRQTRKQMLYGFAALAVLAGLVAWKFWPQPAPVKGGCDPKCVAEKLSATTVKFDVTWKLISPSGGLVYHQYMPNRKPDSNEPLIPNGPAFVARYIRIDKDTIEPWLSYDGNRYSVPVGGAHSGTGFFVSSNGFLLTNRHVAAAWETPYTFPNSAQVGIVFASDGRTPLGVIRQAPDDWIPAKTRQDFGGFKGANDRLEVTLNGSMSPIRAELIRVSERHDVALVRMDMPEAAPMAELNDNYDTIREGEAITILGYPSVTAPVFGFIRDADDMTRGTQARAIPKITVTPGNIGAILRSSEGKEATFSRRDVYQLTANATGAGNSGGPVFDTEGRVIGIFYAGTFRGGATVTYAVPIRYGKELMSLK